MGADGAVCRSRHRTRDFIRDRENNSAAYLQLPADKTRCVWTSPQCQVTASPTCCLPPRNAAFPRYQERLTHRQRLKGINNSSYVRNAKMLQKAVIYIFITSNTSPTYHRNEQVSTFHEQLSLCGDTRALAPVASTCPSLNSYTSSKALELPSCTIFSGDKLTTFPLCFTNLPHLGRFCEARTCPPQSLAGLHPQAAWHCSPTSQCFSIVTRKPSWSRVPGTPCAILCYPSQSGSYRGSQEETRPLSCVTLPNH